MYHFGRATAKSFPSMEYLYVLAVSSGLYLRAATMRRPNDDCNKGRTVGIRRLECMTVSREPVQETSGPCLRSGSASRFFVPV